MEAFPPFITAVQAACTAFQGTLLPFSFLKQSLLLILKCREKRNSHSNAPFPPTTALGRFASASSPSLCHLSRHGSPSTFQGSSRPLWVGQHISHPRTLRGACSSLPLGLPKPSTGRGQEGPGQGSLGLAGPQATGQDLVAITGMESRLADATQETPGNALSLRPHLSSSLVLQDLLGTRAVTVSCLPDMARPWWAVSQPWRRRSPRVASSRSLMKSSSDP